MNIDEAATPEQQAQVWAMLADLEWEAQQKTLEAHRLRVLHFMAPPWPLVFFDEELEAIRYVAGCYQFHPGTTPANAERCRVWMLAFFDEILTAAREVTDGPEERGSSTLFAAGE